MKVNFGNDSVPKLYHISEKNLNGKILTPRVPNNEFIKWGVEDGKTKRVSFARSIGKCLTGLGRNVLGKVFYVFEPDISPDKLKSNIIYPTKDMVPDVHITHEVWVTCPVKLKYRMMIKVVSAGKEHTLIVHRKDTDTDYVGKPCDWEYERVLSPVEEIKNIFSKIRYGWRNPKTNKPFRTKEEFEGKQPDDVWRLGTPEQTISSEVGNCYDTVAISREYLKKAKGIQFRTFWMTLANSKFTGETYTEAPTHTFLIYWDTDDQWKWLEGSWGPYKNNNWNSKNPKDLIKWIGTAMANMEKTDVTVYELNGYPKYGCDMLEFETFCRKGSKVMTCKPEKGSSK